MFVKHNDVYLSVRSGRLSRRRGTIVPVTAISYTSRTTHLVRYQLHVTVGCWNDSSVAAGSSRWLSIGHHQSRRRPRFPRREGGRLRRSTELEGRIRTVHHQLRNNGNPATRSVFPAVSGILSPRPPARPPAIQFHRVWCWHRRFSSSARVTAFPARTFVGNRHHGNNDEGQGRSTVPQPRPEAVRRGGSWPIAGFCQRAAVQAEALEDAECQGSRTICEDGRVVGWPNEHQQIENLSGPAERSAFRQFCVTAK